MTNTSGRRDRASREVSASPAEVYDMFASADRLIRWLPPKGMTGRVLEYDFRQGGRYRIELRYQSVDNGAGKTTVDTDISSGEFEELVPAARIKQTVRFETEEGPEPNPMVMTWTFEPSSGGTLVTVTADDVPVTISKEDHDKGLRGSLDNLADIVSR